jgi:hypothetical protein
MTSSPDRMAILLPLGVAVTMTFCTIVIHGLGLIGIVHFLRYELRLGRAGVLERRVDRSRSHAGRTCRTFDCGRRRGPWCSPYVANFLNLRRLFIIPE